MFNVRIVSKNPGAIKKAVTRMRRALVGPKRVKVGFPAGRAGADVVERAVFNEFGTSRGIPERPFLRNAMADNRDGYKRLTVDMARRIVKGEADMPGELNRLGIKAVGDIQQSIGSNIGPANAPETVKRKGSSKTLIDTGEMRQRVTHQLD